MDTTDHTLEAGTGVDPDRTPGPDPAFEPDSDPAFEPDSDRAAGPDSDRAAGPDSDPAAGPDPASEPDRSFGPDPASGPGDVIERAEAEAEAIVAQAVAEAAEELEAARERGREMIAEARLARDRMLSEVGRRRHQAQVELDRLRAARDRLLAAYQVVRRTLDEATGELGVAESEARIAAEEAGRRTQAERSTLESMMGATSAARLRAALAEEPDGARPAATTTAAGEPADRAGASEGAGRAFGRAPFGQGGGPERGHAGGGREGTDGASGEGDDGSGDREGTRLPAPTDAGLAEHRPASLPPSPTPPRAGSHRRLRSVPAPTPASSGRSSVDRRTASGVAAGRCADEGVAAVPGPASGPTTVDPLAALFDELRSGRGPRTAPGVVSAEPAAVPAGDGTPRPPAGAGDAPSGSLSDPADLPPGVGHGGAAVDGGLAADPPPEAGLTGATRVGTDVDDAAPGAGRAEAGEAAPGSGDGEPSEAVALRARRDELLEPLEGGVARAVKRFLREEQNELLDRLRREGPVVARPGGVPDRVARLAATVGPDLVRACAAGSTFLAPGALPTGSGGVGGRPQPWSGEADPEGAGREAALGLAAEVVETIDRSLTAALGRCSGPGVSGELTEVTEGVSAAYRQWRSQDLEATARRHTHAAFSGAAFDAVAEGALTRWVASEGGACPDCDDNALAGPVPRGSPYPTGQAHPPAHPGCRCLLVVVAGR